MPGFNNGVMWADNVRFDGTGYPGAITTDGQILIGATVSPNIRVGTLTAGTGIAITPGAGTISIATADSVANSYDGDSGTATPLANNLDIIGATATGGTATNIVTSGATNVMSIALKNSISQPTTNAAGTAGVYSLGGDRFLHNYSSAGAGGNNMFLGRSCGNLTLTGNQNSGVGADAFASLTSGSDNSSYGYSSGYALRDGRDNAYYGNNSGAQVVSGGYNVGIGSSAHYAGKGSYNTCVGEHSLSQLVNGNYCVSLGYSSSFNYTGAESSNVIIQNQGVIGESNTIRIGTQGAGNLQENRCFIAGITGVTVSNTALVTLDTTTGQLGTKTIANLPTWTVINADQPAVVGAGYFCNKVGLLSLSLPAVSAVGDIIEVSNINTAAGTILTQGAGQQIYYGNLSTTLGAGGTLASIAVGDSLKIVCRVANTFWQVVSSVGSWTVV